MALQYARAMGLRVIAIDTGSSKKEMCLRLGAEGRQLHSLLSTVSNTRSDGTACAAFIDFKETSDTAEQVKRITGKGAHAVSKALPEESRRNDLARPPQVIVTGGTKSAYAGTLKFLRNGGTVCGIGLPPKETAFFGGYAEEIIRNRLTVTGTWNNNSLSEYVC